MSDATDDLPSQAELDAKSFAAIVRRAPRFVRIIVTGAGVGFSAGVVIALALPGHGAAYRAAVALLVGLGFATIGALSTGAIATRADGRDPWAHTRAWNPWEVPELPATPAAREPDPSTDEDG